MALLFGKGRTTNKEHIQNVFNKCEWAYAGFFFLMSGAVFSHLAVGDPLTDYFGPTLLLLLIAIS